MTYPVIGQTLQLEVAEGIFAGKYQSRVGEIDKNHIFIEIPLKKGTDRLEPFPDHVTMLIHYRTPDSAQCSFHARVVGRDIRNIPLLKITKPDLSEIHRLQRREFFRVPLTTPIEVLSVNVQTKEVSVQRGYTQDISGGGLSFILKNDHSIYPNDVIGISFELPIDGAKVPIQAKARVRRRTDRRPKETGILFSVKFFEMKETDRQTIVRYSLKRQLEMREKGWFNNN